MQSYIDALYDAAKSVPTTENPIVDSLVVKHIIDEAIKLEQLIGNDMYIRTSTAVIAPDLTVVEAGIDKTGFTYLDLGSNQARPNFDTADWDNTWSSSGMSTWFVDRPEGISVIDLAGKTAMQIEHVPDPPNGTANVQSGGTLDSGFVTNMTVAEKIYIPSGFDWGTNSQATIKAGYGIRSQANASGGLAIPNGFSSRPQIRRSGVSEYYGVYVYESNTPGYGDNYLTDVEVIYDQWVEFAQEVVMNSAYGNSDGTLKVWIDGVQKLDITGIQWMSSQNSGDPSVPSIRGMSFNSFHGGSGDASWSPATTQYPSYSDIAYNVA